MSESAPEWIYESPDNGKTVYRRKSQDDNRELVPNEEITQCKVNVILNQTEYTEEEARVHLARYNNDEIAVIRYYLTGSADPKDATKASQVTSKNQLVYTEIRKFMDTCVKK
jgi:hypothetical protein